MKEDNNITNWWEKDDDDLNVNEEASDQVEETTEEAVEEVEEVVEEVEEEEVAEAVSDSSGDYELHGSDSDLVNHVSNLIHDLGKTVTICDNHEDLNGGKIIILCGDNWDAFVHALKANESSRSMVIQLQHDAEHKAAESGFTTGAEVITYTLGENKRKVAGRISSHL
jgi:RecB family endonuclease NucS